MSRGQATLLALGVALLLVTAAVGVGLVTATGAFASEERPSGERRVATDLSTSLVAASSPLAVAPNVLGERAMADFDAEALRSRYPALTARSVAVRLDGRTLAAAGDPSGGTTIRRPVLVRAADERTLRPTFGANDSVVLPNRTGRVAVTVAPTAGVQTIRVNGAVRRHEPTGLVGDFELRVDRTHPANLTLASPGPVPPGSVELEFVPWETRPATLVVTVDA